MNYQFGFASNWTVREGVAFGLQQPTISGRLAVKAVQPRLLERLEAELTANLREPVPEVTATTCTTTRFAHRLLYLIGAIQREAGIAVSPLHRLDRLPRSNPECLYFETAIPYSSHQSASLAIKWVTETVRLITEQQPAVDDQEAIAACFAAARKRLTPFAPGRINDFHIAVAAHRLDIPLIAIDDRLISLGTGSRSRWMSSSITDRTPGLAVDLAHDKFRTAALLRRAGLPGARQFRVASGQEAVTAAQKLGYPVVVKPSDQEQGRGVYADLRNDESVRTAFAAASDVSAVILVEQWVAGQTHRLTVFQGQVVRVSRRLAGGVVGDGVQDVAALVTLWQQDEANSRRSQRLGKVLLELDDEAQELLAQEGLSASHVPPAGHYLRLRRRDNLNTGGTNEFVELSAVHPDNLQLAVSIATLLRIDFLGIDLIATDIARPWHETGALICELNAQPQLGVSHDPTLFERILQQLGDGGFRIPAHLIVCPAAALKNPSWLVELSKRKACNGFSSASGLWVDGCALPGSFASAFQAARTLLLRPDVEAAVCAMTPTELWTYGLPQNRWDSLEIMRTAEMSGREKRDLATARKLLSGHVTEGRRRP